jgi:Putative beta-barrel porin 2
MRIVVVHSSAGNAPSVRGAGLPTKLCGSVALVSMALTLGTVSPSFAQYDGSSGQGGAPASGQGAATTGGGSYGGWEAFPAGPYQQGLAVGGWIFAPEIFVGGVFNSNTNQLATNEDNGWSLRVSPRITGYYDGGIYKTTVYGVMDGQFFNTNTIAATAGIGNTYQPQQDWSVNSFFNYTRETSLFNSALNFNNNAIGPPGAPPSGIPIVLNPFGTTPSVNPIAYNQFTAGASINKTWDQAFASLGATGFYILYDNQSDLILSPFATSTNGADIWVQGRVGYHFIPGYYVFAEGDGIFQRFQNSVFDTNGYRVIGGLGMDDSQSLFRGEIYGGYQAQQQSADDNVFGTPSIPLVTPNGIPTNVSSGVYGARLNYYPTPYWTWIASVDQTLGVQTQLAPNVPEGTPSKVTTALLQTTYAIGYDWSIGVRGGYTQGWYFGLAPENQGWLVGASFNYAIWRNLLLTLDYQYTNEHSSAPLSSFAQSTYTAGLTYRY